VRCFCGVGPSNIITKACLIRPFTPLFPKTGCSNKASEEARKTFAITTKFSIILRNTNAKWFYDRAHQKKERKKTFCDNKEAKGSLKVSDITLVLASCE
jgi:hypothetical protein